MLTFVFALSIVPFTLAGPGGLRGEGPTQAGNQTRIADLSVKVSDLDAEQQKRLIDGFVKLKHTPSPWASGVGKDGRPVPNRWRNLSWYDTLVTIHMTQFTENAFAHMGPAFPGWHRLFIDLLEEGMNDVLGNPSPPFVMPYWDWTSPKETAATFSLVGGDGSMPDYCVQSGPFAYDAGKWKVELLPTDYPAGHKEQCLKRRFSAWGVGSLDVYDSSHLPALSDVRQALQVQRFDSYPYDASALGSLSFRNVMEGYATPDNRGGTATSAENNSFHGLHNIAHLYVGEDMVPTSSPNDPVFWFHHKNIDRLFQSWLANAGVVYGTGPPVRRGTQTFGYPAQIKSVFGRPDCHAENRVTVKAFNDGAGLTLKIGTGSDDDWIKFLKCAYFLDAAGIVNNQSYGKRVIIGFPPEDPRAALVPDAEHTFIDPLVFRATVDGQPMVYEEFTLAQLAQDTQLVYTDPSVYNRQLSFSLLQPAWFNRHAHLSAATSCSVSNAFGTKTRGCMPFRALVVTGNGSKMDMEGWNPLHYWMPGYFNQVKGMELAVRFTGGSNIPAQSCFGGTVDGTDCKLEKGVARDSRPAVQAFNQAPGEQTYIPPDSSSFAHVQLDTSDCLSATQMVSQGFVKDGSTNEATAMAPAGAKFCVVAGRLLDNPLLTDEANRKRNEQTFGSRKKPASVFATADLARRAAALPQGLDITDHVYSGARPGHNAQDLMAPFDQLGYRRSPAEFFTTDSASYDELYGTLPFV